MLHYRVGVKIDDLTHLSYCMNSIVCMQYYVSGMYVGFLCYTATYLYQREANPIPLSLSLRMICDIAALLRHLHHSLCPSLLHRDLKGPNVLGTFRS